MSKTKKKKYLVIPKSEKATSHHCIKESDFKYTILKNVNKPMAFAQTILTEHVNTQNILETLIPQILIFRPTTC